MAAVPDPEMQEALRSWGYMLRADNTPTVKLDRLLRGIAACISSSFGQTDNNDLSPVQLAAFYKSVGGDYDTLFLEMPHHSIAFIYKSLGCLHSLQPGSDDVHAAPSVPSLKAKGFVTWQTVQLLLVPDAHVTFLQNALRIFDVRDPELGTPFPKLLPATCFPARPNAKMEAWHSRVSEQLRMEAERGATVHPRPALARSSGEISVDGSSDERADAAKYFSNPVNRNREGKPGIIKQITNAPVKIFEGGKAVATTVFQGGKMVANPLLFSGGRRRSLPDRTVSMESADSSKIAAPRAARRSPRRPRSPSISSGDSDVERIRSTRVRRNKSINAAGGSPGGGHFSNMDSRREESSSSRNRRSPRAHGSRSPGRRSNADFRPSGSPPWAATVGRGQQPPEYLSPEQRRPSMNQRASSEQRRGYDQGQQSQARPQGQWNEPRYRATHADGYHSETRAESHPGYSNPQAPFQPMSRTESYDGGRDVRQASTRLPEQGDYFAGDHGRRASAYKAGSPVNGVKGRIYPNETPWQ